MAKPKKVSWNTIKRYFRGIDIALMRDEVGKTQVLDGYTQVVNIADAITGRVTNPRPDQVMPPPPYARWSQEKIDNFTAWADPNTPLEVDPALQQQAEPFVKLSEFLTGFTNLGQDPDLALKYLGRLQAKPQLQPIVEELIVQYSAAPDDNQFAAEVLEGPDASYKEVAEIIILLWYTGAFFEGRFPADFGTPEDNQYTDGLVWLAIQAHPMAYSTEGAQYWAKRPQANGRNTGLGSTANRAKPQESPSEFV